MADLPRETSTGEGREFGLAQSFGRSGQRFMTSSLEIIRGRAQQIR
jgi:hypothetical protein